MTNKISTHDDFNSIEPTIPLSMALLLLLGAAFGTVIALMLLGAWLPGLSQSLSGSTPQAYWDLARVGGIVAYLLLWLSMMFGLILTNKVARVWPGGPTAMELHQFTALLGFAFAIFHGLILLGDRYINYSLLQLVIPFASVNYHPVWVGMGQIALYALIPVTFSFYFRKRIGYTLWRSIHYGSFAVYSLVTIHGLLAGSDTTNPLMLAVYALTGLSVYFFMLYRIFSMQRAAAPAP